MAALNYKRPANRKLITKDPIKMRYCFGEYGCLKCGKPETVYSSTGKRARCAIVVQARVVASLKRHFERIGVASKDRPIQAFLGDRTTRQIARSAGPLPRKARQAKGRVQLEKK